MSNDLDDLFRQELDGHESAPGADLWARLQARTAADAAAGPAGEAHPVDARFRAGLAGHATPPRRELWERLEDEHLRPAGQRRRPVVAWGRLAVAASLLLLVLAGGAGLWWGRRGPAAGPVAATHPAGRGAAGNGAATTSHQPAPAGTVVAGSTQKSFNPNSTTSALTTELAGKQQGSTAAAVAATETGRTQKNQKYFSPQATGLAASPSSSPVASTAAQHRPATVLRPVPSLPKATSKPDAATSAELAHSGGRNTPAGQLPTQSEAPVLAAASPQVIEVEVRRGTASRPAPGAVAAAPAPAAEPEATPQRRLRLGGLLRQAGRAVRGESVSLAEATGLPEALTVQAQLGDRVVVKTIRL